MEYEIKCYELELIHTHTKRKAILLNLNGNWGEIAPLPGWSKETLEEAEGQLRAHLEGHVPFENLFPSVAFGVESAMTPLPDIDLPISSLLMGTYEQIIKKAETLSTKSVKLKISGLSKTEAKDLIYKLKDRFSLRIDLNRAWDLKEAAEFFAEFKPDDFDYIEEPLKNPAELKFFPLPIALDESLLEVAIESLPNLKAIVYKPTLLGGLSRCKTFLRYNKPIVLSSAFESGIGLLNIAAIAQNLDLTSPIGIDTCTFLKQDHLSRSLALKNGRLIRHG